MSSITLFYLIFAAIDLVLLNTVVNQWRLLLQEWRRAAGSWHHTITLLAALIHTFSSVVWLFMAYMTLSSWLVSLNPSVPKPEFLIIWIIALMLFALFMGITNIISQYLQSKQAQDTAQDSQH